MPSFYVSWDIDIYEVDSPRVAAQKALDIMRDPQSTATVFHVRNTSTGEETVVDLEP